MDIKRHFKRTALAAALAMPFAANAEIIEVSFPYIEIGTGGGADVAMADGALDISGSAMDILQFAGESVDDIDPDQIFTLTGTMQADNLYDGSFSIGGGLLSGTFTDLDVKQVTFLGDTTGSAAGFLDFTGGSLQQGAIGGNVLINWNGDAYSGAGVISTGKLGVPAVPVPAAVWLFGSGLLGLVGIARRKVA